MLDGPGPGDPYQHCGRWLCRKHRNRHASGPLAQAATPHRRAQRRRLNATIVPSSCSSTATTPEVAASEPSRIVEGLVPPLTRSRPDQLDDLAMQQQAAGTFAGDVPRTIDPCDIGPDAGRFVTVSRTPRRDYRHRWRGPCPGWQRRISTSNGLPRWTRRRKDGREWATNEGGLPSSHESVASAPSGRGLLRLDWVCCGPRTIMSPRSQADGPTVMTGGVLARLEHERAEVGADHVGTVAAEQFSSPRRSAPTTNPNPPARPA